MTAPPNPVLPDKTPDTAWLMPSESIATQVTPMLAAGEGKWAAPPLRTVLQSGRLVHLACARSLLAGARLQTRVMTSGEVETTTPSTTYADFFTAAQIRLYSAPQSAKTKVSKVYGQLKTVGLSDVAAT